MASLVYSSADRPPICHSPYISLPRPSTARHRPVVSVLAAALGPVGATEELQYSTHASPLPDSRFHVQADVRLGPSSAQYFRNSSVPKRFDSSPPRPTRGAGDGRPSDQSIGPVIVADEVPAGQRSTPMRRLRSRSSTSLRKPLASLSAEPSSYIRRRCNAQMLYEPPKTLRSSTPSWRRGPLLHGHGCTSLSRVDGGLLCGRG